MIVSVMKEKKTDIKEIKQSRENKIRTLFLCDEKIVIGEENINNIEKKKTKKIR